VCFQAGFLISVLAVATALYAPPIPNAPAPVYGPPAPQSVSQFSAPAPPPPPPPPLPPAAIPNPATFHFISRNPVSSYAPPVFNAPPAPAPVLAPAPAFTPAPVPQQLYGVPTF
jgi:hypothetical protein